MKEQIAEWLRQQGYPMELSVGRLLRDQGWHVEHSPWYTDPESGKSREVDIQATIYAGDGERRRWISVGLVIECKQTTSKPWVVFTAPRDTTALQGMNSIVADDFSRDLLYSVPPEVGLASFLRPSNTIGHAAVRAFADPKNGDPTGPYSALRSAVNAAAAIGVTNEEISLNGAPQTMMAHLLLPTVVIDGPLFSYSIEENDDESLAEMPWIQTSIASPVDGSMAIVTIVNRSSLSEYVAELTPAAKEFALSMTAYIENVHQLTSQRRTRAAVLRAGGPDILAG